MPDLAEKQKEFRFLCMPGAMTNAETFRVQLEPFMHAVAAVKPGVGFYITQGTVEATPPEGFDDFYGPPPHLRFLDFEGIENVDMVERLRDFPEERTAEHTLRKLLPEGVGPVKKGLVKALDDLYRTMKECGPFDGVLGYSEGATMAATLLLDEQRRCQASGTEPTLKCAIFMAGWPPLILDRDSPVLGDTDSEIIDVPTLHVLGTKDPFLAGSEALYRVCNNDTGMIFDHGQGHIIVRDVKNLEGLAIKVHRLVRECQ